jgi:chromatin assembly factor 1 subunit B
MWTPPLTPAHGQGSTHSAGSSVSGIPGLGAVGRRESERSESEQTEGASGTKKRELQSQPEAEEGREPKKRRIVPTPVSYAASGEEVSADDAIASTEEHTPAA